MSIKDRESLVSTLLGHNQESLQDVLKWQKLFRKAVDDLVAEQLQPFFNHHGLWGQTLFTVFEAIHRSAPGLSFLT